MCIYLKNRIASSVCTAKINTQKIFWTPLFVFLSVVVQSSPSSSSSCAQINLRYSGFNKTAYTWARKIWAHSLVVQGICVSEVSVSVFLSPASPAGKPINQFSKELRVMLVEEPHPICTPSDEKETPLGNAICCAQSKRVSTFGKHLQLRHRIRRLWIESRVPEMIKKENRNRTIENQCCSTKEQIESGNFL